MPPSQRTVVTFAGRQMPRLTVRNAWMNRMRCEFEPRKLAGIARAPGLRSRLSAGLSAPAKVVRPAASAVAGPPGRAMPRNTLSFPRPLADPAPGCPVAAPSARYCSITSSRRRSTSCQSSQFGAGRDLSAALQRRLRRGPSRPRTDVALSLAGVVPPPFSGSGLVRRAVSAHLAVRASGDGLTAVPPSAVPSHRGPPSARPQRAWGG